MATTRVLSPVRSAATMPRLELEESAYRRIESLSAIYGTDSPQVRGALARWGKVLERQPERDDLMLLVQATGGA